MRPSSGTEDAGFFTANAALENTGFARLRKNQEKKPQISPLRYAPVEMTNLLGN
jgi:hypothetical protein